MTRMSMLRVLSVILIIVASTAPAEPAYGQTSDANGVQRYAHVFVSNGAKLRRLGGARSVLHFGFGMEWLHPRGLGLGFEAGPRFEDHDFMRFDDILLSVDAHYHPRSRSNPRN